MYINDNNSIDLNQVLKLDLIDEDPSNRSREDCVFDLESGVYMKHLSLIQRSVILPEKDRVFTLRTSVSV